MNQHIESICVYCASSRKVNSIYSDAAKKLGIHIAENGYKLVYGGGVRGTMGTVANAALAAQGTVLGIMPKFMCKLEWNHPGLSELVMVETLHERKQLMLDRSDAIVALPGGSGTLDELLEAISIKRLGLFTGPIIIVNINHFYDPLIALLDTIIEQHFMDERHRDIWSVVTDVNDVIEAVENAPAWSDDAQRFAGV